MSRTTKKTDAATKANKAVAAAKQGQKTKKSKKVYHTPRFHRPKTLQLPATKPSVRLVPRLNKMDDFRVVKTPLTTEAALKKVEMDNTLVFLCDVDATKPQIKAAVTRRYKVKVVKVRTLIRPDCQKKAFVRLAKEYDALEIANKIGIL